MNEHFDYVQHAIADARRVLLAAESHDLAWSAKESLIVVEGPFTTPSCFYYDVFGDQSFSVTQEDLLDESDVVNFFSYVEEADRKEVESFVHFKVFELDSAKNSFNTVDCVWVRKWISRNPPQIKSRCCGSWIPGRSKERSRQTLFHGVDAQPQAGNDDGSPAL